MLKDEISDEWLGAMLAFFEKHGTPEDWCVYREKNSSRHEGEEWGVSSGADMTDEKLYVCETFDEARTFFGAFLLAHEILTGAVVMVEVGEGCVIGTGADA